MKFSRSRDNVCQLTSRVMYPVVIWRDRGEEDQPDVLPGEFRVVCLFENFIGDLFVTKFCGTSCDKLNFWIPTPFIFD